MQMLLKNFKSLRSRYQENLETSMRESDSIFDSVQLMYYKVHVLLVYYGSYIDSPDRIKKEKSNNKSKKYRLK